jgi:hypothetical protein
MEDLAVSLNAQEKSLSPEEAEEHWETFTAEAQSYCFNTEKPSPQNFDPYTGENLKEKR